LAGVEAAALDAFTAAAVANVKSIRQAIRPLDFGLIACSLQQLGASQLDELIVPLLRTEASSARLSPRLGGKNGQLVAEFLASTNAALSPSVGDGAAVRAAPTVASQTWSAGQVMWPYGEQHTGVLGVIGV
jgi:hypothetical protein